MKTFIKFSLLLVLFSCGINAKPKKINYIIPFEFYNGNRVIIKLRVNDSKEELNFLYDTGARTIVDKTVANRIGLKSTRKQEVVSSSDKISMDLAEKQKIVITKDISVNNVNIVLADLSHIQEIKNVHIDGVIGMDLFWNYMTKIDFEKNELSFYTLNCILDTTEYTSIPYSTNGEEYTPSFPITIELENGKKFTDTILFDSGSGNILEVGANYNEKNQIILAHLNKETKQMQSFTPAMYVNGKLKSLAIDTFKFKNLYFFAYTNSNLGTANINNYMGILGSKIIYRFDFIINHNKKRLYLKPNKYYSNPF